MHRSSAAIGAFALALATAVAQNPSPAKPEPVTLVSQAEKLLLKKEKDLEDAVLLLWQALDQIVALPANPVLDAATLSARFLLQDNDPRETERRRVFTAVAKLQVDLAAAYRGKKWLETAAERLAVADRYDREAGVKERPQLEAAKAKAAASPPASGAASPAAAPAAAPAPASQPCALLQKSNTLLASGDWRVVGDAIECKAPDGQNLEWVTKGTHEDNEIVVDFRAIEPDKPHNATLAVGQTTRANENFSGFRFQCDWMPSEKMFGIMFWEIRGMETEMLGRAWVTAPPIGDGWHRLAVQVHGNRLRGQLDQCPPVEVATKAPVRGYVGLVQGIADVGTCAVRFRNLRVEPLPADQPSDDELRAKAANENQNAITEAVGKARALLAQKQPEAAAMRLRETLTKLDAMEAGVLRDNLRKAIEPLLAQADTLAPKRKKAMQDCAAELAGLAKQYADAGLVRAALAMASRAAAFDPDGQAANVAALREKVQQWNVDQATAHAAELAPPNDDGTKLREWFEKGRRLDTSYQPFLIEGAVARAELAAEGVATWLPHPLAKPLPKASVFVHLPAIGSTAGLYFDVVDSTQCGLATLTRRRDGLRLTVSTRLANKWTTVRSSDLVLDAWRLDAWLQLTVETGDKGVIARHGTIELNVPRQQLAKATGEVGLFAENAGKGVARIELRAFQPGQ